ncbi:MAG: transcriptional coactivator hfi1/ADA1 [Trizodia sp. TS-e1964]|nr:MAG: transcriptional coactivator hfi1/ADA1 [Trizodia sp. TS-e1964]
MPDINPTSLSRTAASQTAASTATGATSKSGSLKPLATPGKVTKAAPVIPRLNLEQVHSALRGSLGTELWAIYKKTMSLFFAGLINQTELGAGIDYFMAGDPKRIHWHNQMLSGIYANLTRDAPEQGVAAWVTAPLKLPQPPKVPTGNTVEERLKNEIRQLPPRDRRRLKDLREPDPLDPSFNIQPTYRQAMSIRLPDVVPVSAGGLNKTNWDLEIRKRYTQPLAADTGELPDAEAVQGRIVPICYEEGVVGGCNDFSAQFVSIAAETFIKEILSSVLRRTRSNGPNYIMTSSYKRQLEREEKGWLAGTVEKAGGHLLPVEQLAARQRSPLNMADMRLALQLGDMYLGQFPMAMERIVGSVWDCQWDLVAREAAANAVQTTHRRRDMDGDIEMTNGYYYTSARTTPKRKRNAKGNFSKVNATSDPATEGWGWEGGGLQDQNELAGILDECLAAW